MSREAVLRVVIRHGKEQDAVLVRNRACAAKMSSTGFGVIGQSMGTMLLDVINSIVAKYPELKPSSLD